MLIQCSGGVAYEQASPQKSYQILKILYLDKDSFAFQHLPILILNKWREIYNKYTYLMAEQQELINVVALVKVKPENIKDVEPLVQELAKKSREEAGVIRYDIFRVKEKEGVYVFLEQYKNEADFAAHKETEHFKTIIAQTAPFLLEPPTIVSLEKEKI